MNEGNLRFAIEAKINNNNKWIRSVESVASTFNSQHTATTLISQWKLLFFISWELKQQPHTSHTHAHILKTLTCSISRQKLFSRWIKKLRAIQNTQSHINFSEELFKLITFPHSPWLVQPLWAHHRDINGFYHSPRTMSAYRATDNCQFQNDIVVNVQRFCSTLFHNAYKIFHIRPTLQPEQSRELWN